MSILAFNIFLSVIPKMGKFLDQALPSGQPVDQPCNKEIKPYNQEVQP